MTTLDPATAAYPITTPAPATSAPVPATAPVPITTPAPATSARVPATAPAPVPATAADPATSAPTPPARPSARGHFRPDIEGLRAVAVLAVLAYHVRLPGFTGGLIGVDVFYVISGFLITGLLRRELLSTGSINFVTFYARRARRLLPAALLVIAVTVVVSFFTLSRLRFPDVAGDAAAAALYVSNYRFVLNATDYLAAGTDPSPLLHYWSLAVEEQFYLFWPLLIFLGARLLSPRRLALLIVPVAVVSLIGCITWTDIAAQWAFFSLPTRAWELALGALIEIGLLRLPARAGTRVATATGWLGLGLVLLAVVMITPDTPFPGVVAMVPVVGAGLLIMAGVRPGATPSRWLATPVPRWFGQISYSLYLWHWPLLILVPVMIDRDDMATRLLLAVAAIGLAALSTRYVEIPFREGRILRMPPMRSLGMALGASVVVALVAVGLAGLPGLFQPSPASAQVPGSPTALVDPTPVPSGPPVGSPAPAPTSTTATATSSAPASGPSGGPTKSPASTTPSSPVPAQSLQPTVPPLPAPVLSGPLPAGLRPPLLQARQDLPVSYSDGCQLNFATVTPAPCVYGDPNSRTTVVLFGDSHAAQWLPALQQLAAQRDWRLVSLTKSSCPAVNIDVWNTSLERVFRECDQWRKLALERITTERPALVVTASARAYDIVDATGRHPFADALPAWSAGLVSELDSLARLGTRVVYMADTPRLGSDPLECLASHAVIEDCPSPRDQMVDPAYAALEAAAVQQAGVDMISATDWLCPGTSCPLVRGTYLVYRDNQHLTATFTAEIAPLLGAAIGPVP